MKNTLSAPAIRQLLLWNRWNRGIHKAANNRRWNISDSDLRDPASIQLPPGPPGNLAQGPDWRSLLHTCWLSCTNQEEGDYKKHEAVERKLVQVCLLVFANVSVLGPWLCSWSAFVWREHTFLGSGTSWFSCFVRVYVLTVTCYIH